MAVPRNRMSNARKNSRRAHHAKTVKNVSYCDQCDSPHLPHTICHACGYYNNYKVIHEKGES